MLKLFKYYDREWRYANCSDMFALAFAIHLYQCIAPTPNIPLLKERKKYSGLLDLCLHHFLMRRGNALPASWTGILHKSALFHQLFSTCVMPVPLCKRKKIFSREMPSYWLFVRPFAFLFFLLKTIQRYHWSPSGWHLHGGLFQLFFIPQKLCWEQMSIITRHEWIC